MRISRSVSDSFGVPYGNRTRVAAVKEKRPIVMQRNLAAWMALYRTLQTHEYCYWTLNGRAKDYFLSTTPHRETQGHHWTAVKFCIMRRFMGQSDRLSLSSDLLNFKGRGVKREFKGCNNAPPEIPLI
jgi:hypothetical protein